LLLLHTAWSTESSHLLLGTSLTSLSVSLISSISQGGGFVVREEAQEEWQPTVHVRSKRTVRVVRPLRDIGMKECAVWAWWRALKVVGKESILGGKQGVGALTKSKCRFPFCCVRWLLTAVRRFHRWTGTRLSFHCVYDCADLR
jgi:cytoplasmic tRNA 2-thiolation protein 2